MVIDLLSSGPAQDILEGLNAAELKKKRKSRSLDCYEKAILVIV